MYGGCQVRCVVRFELRVHEEADLIGPLVPDHQNECEKLSCSLHE